MYLLIVAKTKKTFLYKFKTVSEAYNCYLQNYATLGDHLYYFLCCGKRLSKVKEERVMESVLRNVAGNNIVLVKIKGE